ncbi:MAG: hypothetical protein R3B06_24330 [Kofleriaceae bacterium]
MPPRRRPPTASDWILIRLRRFADRSLRVRQLAVDLGAEPDRAAVAAAALLERSEAGDDPEVRAAVTCLVAALAELDYPGRSALYAAAVAADARAVARLVLDASPPTVRPAELARQLQPERPLRARGRPLTLGERKALARRPRGDALTQLLADPHPAVVEILLDNPQLTEREVVRVAASRPAVPAALARVAEHPRWAPRVGVRRALALNPHTPVHVALRLLVTLAPADWRQVLAATELAPAVRDAAAELAHARGRRSTAIEAAATASETASTAADAAPRSAAPLDVAAAADD